MYFLNANNDHLISILLLITGAIILSGCNNKKQAVPAAPESLSLTFEEQVTIPTNTEKEQLVSPSVMRTDGKGDMYIADADLHKIQVFDRTGQYRRSTGRPGKGPGEFVHINTMEINAQNDLLIFDGSNQRITRFSAAGDILSTYVSFNDGIHWPWDVRQLNGNRYLLLYKNRDVEAGEHIDPPDLHAPFFHVYDRTFQHRISSFGSMDSLMGLKKEFSSLYSFHHSGVICTTKNNAVWYAPTIYRGQLYKFQKWKKGWTLTKTSTGQLIPQMAIDSDEDADGAMFVSRYTNKGPVSYAGKIQSESMGLFILKDGRLVHLSSQLKGKKRVMLVEVFSKQGKLTGTGQLKSFTFNGATSSIPIGAVWKDKDDRFYLIDNRDIPVVRGAALKGYKTRYWLNDILWMLIKKSFKINANVMTPTNLFIQPMVTHVKTLSWMICLLAVLASCGSGSKKPPATVTTTVVNGKNPLIDPAHHPELAWPAFIRPAGDYFMVYDGQLQKIFKYNYKGKKLLSFGAKGRGPGEFLSLTNYWIRDDHYLLYDFNGAKMVRYSLDGSFLGEQPVHRAKLTTSVALLSANRVVHPAPARRKRAATGNRYLPQQGRCIHGNAGGKD